MNRVTQAIEAGRCALGVSGSLLNDAEVMLALTERAALPSMALSGHAQAPVTTVNAAALGRTSQPGGVLVLVNPEAGDLPGIQQIANLLGRASHKPQILVVAQQYNPFLFASVFRGFKVDHLKIRGKQFLKDLPLPPQGAEGAAVELPKAKAAGGGDAAPKFAFVGRDEELEQLEGMLGQGGPIVISGPAGVGKTWLLEHALATAGLKRLPDLVLGWGTGADTLLARIAEIAKAGGSDALSTLLAGPHTPAAAVEKAIEALQNAPGTDGQVFVVHDLHVALGRDNDFFRKGRLELLLEALLTHSYPLRIVFLSRAQPIFYRERADEPLRRMTLGGVKGRFLHEIFEAYKAPEFPREKFGPVSEKIHGHPMAARTLAIEVRERADGVDKVDDPKFFRMDGIDDVAPIKKSIEKRIEKLDADERRSLALVAHFRLPITGQLLADIGISRKPRIALLADGLLDMVGTVDDKRYQVHPLVRSGLPIRETSDFDILAKMSDHFGGLWKSAEDPVEKLAFAQESNRTGITGRVNKKPIDIGYPDDDAVLESVTGLIRSKKPHYEMARQRLDGVLKRNPGNSDAWLLRLELMQRMNVGKDEIQAAIDAACDAAPVPELFHQAVTFYVARRARGKAAQLLEKAVGVLPNESRLHTRLAALLMRQGRRKDAIEHLQTAMALDPMLPDAYGLLGTARRDEGLDALDQAHDLLREAVRLAPEDPTQLVRLVDLLLARARVETDNREAYRTEARDLLERAIKSERKTPDAHLLLATLIREDGGDLERAAWLLKKAKKLTERGHERNFALALESALQGLARGELDLAEKELRELAAKEPSEHRVFAGLARLLEAKQLFIPAHAEFMRARERTPQSSLARLEYEAELARLQAVIEAQVAGLAAGGMPEIPDIPTGPTPSAAGHQRVIRRRRSEQTGGEGTSDVAAAEGAEATPATDGGDAGDAPSAADVTPSGDGEELVDDPNAPGFGSEGEEGGDADTDDDGVART